MGQQYLNDMNFAHLEPLQENQESQDHHPNLSIKNNGSLCQECFFLILNIIILKQILFVWPQLATHVTMAALLTTKNSGRFAPFFLAPAVGFWIFGNFDFWDFWDFWILGFLIIGIFDFWDFWFLGFLGFLIFGIFEIFWIFLLFWF